MLSFGLEPDAPRLALLQALKLTLRSTSGDERAEGFRDCADRTCRALLATLQPKQAMALLSPASEILYGGAAGGGKSYVDRVQFVIAPLVCRGLQGMFFRLQDGELESQVYGSGGFEELLSEVVDLGYAEILGGRKLRFANGSLINLHHFEHWRFHRRYKVEPHLLGIDEAGDFEYRKVQWLRSRLRLADYRSSLRDQLREEGVAEDPVEIVCGKLLGWWYAQSVRLRKQQLAESQNNNDDFGIRRAAELLKDLATWKMPKWATAPRIPLTASEVFGQLLLFFYHVLPRSFLTANPGGISHHDLKQGFIDPVPSGQLFTPTSDGKMLRLFVRALVEDNALQDEDYGDKTEGIGDLDLARAMRYGDWDIVAGAFFGSVWKAREGEEVPPAVIAPFKTPQSWPTYRGHDWGSEDPFYTGWWCIADGTETIDGEGKPFCPPRGSIIWIGEDYGCIPGKNKGLQMDPALVAERGLRAEWDMGIWQWVQPGPADRVFGSKLHVREQDIHDIFLSVASPVDKDKRRGWTFVKPIKTPGSREQRWTLLKAMLQRHHLEGDAANRPRFYVFDTCRHLIRVIGAAPRHSKKPQDIADGCEDHPLDVVGYAVLAAMAPIPSTEGPRGMKAALRRKAQGLPASRRMG